MLPLRKSFSRKLFLNQFSKHAKFQTNQRVLSDACFEGDS